MKLPFRSTRRGAARGGAQAAAGADRHHEEDRWILEGYDEAPIEQKSLNQVGLHAGVILHCCASGANIYSRSSSQRLGKTLTERITSGNEAWSSYVDMGFSNANANHWAAQLREWRHANSGNMIYDQCRQQWIFPSTVRVIVSDDMNTFFIGKRTGAWNNAMQEAYASLFGELAYFTSIAYCFNRDPQRFGMEAGFTLGCQQEVIDMGCCESKAIFLLDTQLWADLRPACIKAKGKTDLWHHGDIRWHETTERN